MGFHCFLGFRFYWLLQSFLRRRLQSMEQLAHVFSLIVQPAYDLTGSYGGNLSLLLVHQNHPDTSGAWTQQNSIVMVRLYARDLPLEDTPFRRQRPSRSAPTSSIKGRLSPAIESYSSGNPGSQYSVWPGRRHPWHH